MTKQKSEKIKIYQYNYIILSIYSLKSIFKKTKIKKQF